jgi:hypothetical protein
MGHAAGVPGREAFTNDLRTARSVLECGGRAGAATPLSGGRSARRIPSGSCGRKRRGAALPAAVQDMLARILAAHEWSRRLAERGRPRPQQCPNCDAPSSNPPPPRSATLLRPGTGALRRRAGGAGTGRSRGGFFLIKFLAGAN